MKLVSIDSPYIREQFLKKVADLPEITDFKIYQDNPESVDDLVERVGDAEMMTLDIFQQITKKILEKTPRLQAIFTQAVGYNNIDIEFAKSKGIKVYNCPGYNSNAVAEFVFALITALSRLVPAAQAHVRAGGWMYRYFEGRELRGRTIGIVGSGNVARKVVSIARGYSMNVLVNTEHPSPQKASIMGLSRFSTLKEILKKSDFVVLCVPLTHETKHLIGKKELAIMRKDAILVNVARQTVVDEEALADALLGGQIGGAVLDVIIKEPFYSKEYSMKIQEMINLPNVIVTPHIAHATDESSLVLGDMFVHNIKNFLKGDSTNCVNV